MDTASDYESLQHGACVRAAFGPTQNHLSAPGSECAETYRDFHHTMRVEAERCGHRHQVPLIVLDDTLLYPALRTPQGRSDDCCQDKQTHAP